MTTTTKDLDGCKATVNADTRNTADSGTVVTERFNDLVRDYNDEWYMRVKRSLGLIAEWRAGDGVVQ